MNYEQFDSILDLNDEPIHDEKARILNKFLSKFLIEKIRYNYISNRKTIFFSKRC
jgi:hypothetical protein